MGGEWGLGAALAMAKIPIERRGFFSGLLQAGYSFGYLLATLASLVVRLVDRARVDQSDHPVPGPRIRGVGSRAGPNARHPHPDS